MDQNKNENTNIEESAPKTAELKPVKKRWWVTPVALIAAIAVILVVVFVNLGAFLMVNEQPVQSDVIVVLAGDEGARTVYGVELYQQGYAGKLLFSGCEHTSADMLQIAVEMGVPESDILIDEQSESTYDNAVYSRQIIEENGFTSAIVITSDYHMRRSRLVFKKEFRGTDVRLVYCSAADPEFNPSKWWADWYSRNKVMTEYIKIAGYFVQGKL